MNELDTLFLQQKLYKKEEQNTKRTVNQQTVTLRLCYYYCLHVETV